MTSDVTTIVRQAGERGLPSLLIGGHAVILLGYIRNTVDLDLLVPEGARAQRLDLLRDLAWEDIRQIVRLCALDPEEESFRALIVRYGGDDALAKIRRFR